MTETASAGGWREAYGGWLFAILFGLSAALGFVGPLGLVIVATAGGLLALPLWPPGRTASTGFLLVCLLALWCAIASTWSPVSSSLQTVAGLSHLEDLPAVKILGMALSYGALVLGADGLTPRAGDRALRIFSFGLTALAVLLIVEAVSNARIYQFMEAAIGQPIRQDLAMRNVAQGSYIIAVLVWPAGMLLRSERRNLLVAILVLGVIGAAALFGAFAPALALAFGLAALGLVLAAGRRGVLVLAAVSAAYFLAAPWLFLAANAGGLFARMKAVLPQSWDARVDIWAFASARVSEHPLLGWGLEASRSWPGRIPLHTHDGALQVWLELGLPGAILMAALWVYLFWTIGQAREGRGFMAVASATAVAYLTIGALSFGAWQEWWLAVGALAACACLALRGTVAVRMAEDIFAPGPFGRA